jgi:predicted ATPase
VKEGQGQVVLLNGEAGIGKSRLLQVLRDGMETAFTSGSELFRPYFQMLLAEAYSDAGQPGEGLHLLGDSQAAIVRTDDRFCETELARLTGALKLRQSHEEQSAAETCFHQALSIARQQQARSWELRAATSLARLWQSQGKRQAAYDLLAPVYEWFTEEFDTADLKEAKTLLQELA